MSRLEELTADLGCNVNEVLEIIDKNARGLSFIIDEDRMLVGVATDGDIRRALLKGAELTDPIKEVMNINFVSLPVDASQKRIRATFSEKVKIIPLCDEDGRLVDFADKYRSHRIPILEPHMGERELEYVQDCIHTNWISSQGKYVQKFEEMFENMHEGSSALAVSNGTVAIHLALEAFGIGPGDEVIVPDLTFAATANAVIHAGASPVFCDIDKERWVIKADDIKKLINENTKAIIPVHLYGQPCDMPAIMRIAKERGLLVIEDCAESLGSRWNGKLVGTFGDAATFSFYGNKTITTGEGGMVTFKDNKITERARILRDHGMNPRKRYWHDEIGYNYRMTNLQAAVGVAQMERFDEILRKKRKLGEYYRSQLKSTQSIEQLPYNSEEAYHTNWLFTILLNKDYERDEVIRKLLINGVEARPVFYPLHKMPPYREYKKGSIKYSIKISDAGLSLPSSTILTKKEVNYVCDVFKRLTKSTLHSLE